ncbi:hypothetical protein B0H67DRAFT_486898 [Lasiosphaeris hirsuta]|uniref:Uncharacterized protein n=1 Tax=Lasiosphaeris hirsuta TaxID=260670 RepID=A0AA40AS93_9PEZI|nr:hypothetical protein B0H67DRAFT_486898 [Lasiosphaeris hirsuta]
MPLSIQIINKTDYTAQRIVTLPSEDTTPLAPGSIRIRSRLVSLTSNNQSYAKIGGLGLPGLAYWDVWPLPASLPAPYNDATTYCRVSAWGYANIVESTIPELPAGKQLRGYLPISTTAEVLRLKPAGLAGHWDEVSSGRVKGLVAIYQRYIEVPEDEDRTDQGWHALMGALFESGYSLNRYSFGDALFHPWGLGMAWGAEDGSLEGAVVVLLAASGKTGVSLAHELKLRGAGQGPDRIVAVGSAKSRALSVATGFYDEVLEYEDVGRAGFDLQGALGGRPTKVVLINLDTRTDALEQWAAALQPKTDRLQIVLYAAPQDEATGQFKGDFVALAQAPDSGVTIVNAGGLREGAVAKFGEEAFWAGLDAAWEKFKADGAVPGLNLAWHQDIESLSEEWAALAKGERGPDVGLLFEL